MKNAENALNFYQIDSEIKSIKEQEGVIIMPSVLAWNKFEWMHDYFEKKPKGGFLLFVKEPISKRLNTLVEMESEKVFQKMSNLIIIEKGLKVKLSSLCRSKNKGTGKHFAKAVVVIKEGAELEFSQGNLWRKNDEFSASYQFVLEKKAKLKTIITNQGEGAKVNTREDVFLYGKKSSADIRIKMIAKSEASFYSESYMHGEEEARGHLDCSGLIVGSEAKIVSIPGLVCNSNKAELTHEASIGKISEEKLTYLRMRGLSCKKATELIINSFLNS